MNTWLLLAQIKLLELKRGKCSCLKALFEKVNPQIYNKSDPQTVLQNISSRRKVHFLHYLINLPVFQIEVRKKTHTAVKMH